MDLKKITAVVPGRKLEKVEHALQRIGVTGITVTQCKGYGEYEYLAKSDCSLPRARIEIFCTSDRAKSIAETIMEEVHTGSMGDGIIAIEPVEVLLRIRTKAEALESEI